MDKFFKKIFYLMVAATVASTLMSPMAQARDDSTNVKVYLGPPTNRLPGEGVPPGTQCGSIMLYNRSYGSLVSCQGFDLQYHAAGWYPVEVTYSGPEACDDFSCTPAYSYSQMEFIPLSRGGEFSLTTTDPRYTPEKLQCPSGYRFIELFGGGGSNGEDHMYSCIKS
jgi:hypothetical protein